MWKDITLYFTSRIYFFQLCCPQYRRVLSDLTTWSSFRMLPFGSSGAWIHAKIWIVSNGKKMSAKSNLVILRSILLNKMGGVEESWEKLGVPTWEQGCSPPCPGPLCFETSSSDQSSHSRSLLTSSGWRCWRCCWSWPGSGWSWWRGLGGRGSCLPSGVWARSRLARATTSRGTTWVEIVTWWGGLTTNWRKRPFTSDMTSMIIFGR